MTLSELPEEELTRRVKRLGYPRLGQLYDELLAAIRDSETHNFPNLRRLLRALEGDTTGGVMVDGCQNGQQVVDGQCQGCGNDPKHCERPAGVPGTYKDVTEGLPK